MIFMYHRADVTQKVATDIRFLQTETLFAPLLHPLPPRAATAMSLPPTLDQVGWEIPASSAARLVGVAGPRMKLARRLPPRELCGRTPSLAFSPSFVEAQEPVGVQAL